MLRGEWSSIPSHSIECRYPERFRMKASRYVFLSLLLVFAAVSLSAQVNDTYVVPASANVAGAFGTRWMTQFSVFNPHLDYPLTVSVTFLPTGGGKGDAATFTVPANAVAFSDNVLDDLFDIKNGSGALLVATFPEDNPSVPNDALSRAFLLESDTFNNSSTGTYGQTIPGVWAGLQDFNSDGISAIAHGVRNIPSQGWRANVGAVNLGRANVSLLVSVYDIDGNTLLDKMPLNVPPLGHTQAGLPVQVDRGSIEFMVDDPTKQAVVFPYVSVIDQLSGDPTYHNPTLLASANVLFKGVLKPVDATVNPGRRIGIDDARAIRATANRVGLRTLRTR